MELIYSYIRALHACIATQLYHLNTFILSCNSGAAHRRTRMFLVTGILPVAFLSFLSGALGQTGDAGKAGTGGKVAEITPLSIGDTIPEELWHLPLQVVNHPEGKETITLSEYKDKLIILDFWATWCAPCIKSLHKLDTLQKEFAHDLRVLPVSPEEGAKMLPFIKTRGWSLPSSTNYKELRQYFPHRAVPYQVWIKSNRLLATTNESQSTHKNIAELIKGESVGNLLIRMDNLTYNSKKPLLFDGNGGNLSDLKYSSVITGYLDGVFGGGGIRTDSIGRRCLRIINADIGRLYRTVASRHNRAILSPSRMIADNVVMQLIPHGNPYYQPEIRPFFYSYELITPVLNDRQLSNYAIDDLNRFFRYTKGIQGRLAKREIPCWVFSLEQKQLIADSISSQDVSETQYLDSKIVFISEPSESVFEVIRNLFFSIETPMINEMAAGKISLEIPYDRENLSFEAVKDVISQQGINVKKEVRNIEVVVIERSN